MSAEIDPATVTITITDIRLAGHCVRGTKTWFEDYGLDFTKFLKDGIDGETFLSTGDPYARQVYDRKLSRG